MTGPKARAGTLLLLLAVVVLLPAREVGAQTSAPEATAVRALPALDDAQWAALVLALSEEGGFFDTDNLISNEGSYLDAVGLLRTLGGGAYLGVGPDQNFSYIAASRPAIAFVVDIRRDNLLHHLLLRALLQLSENRAEYLSRLHGRPAPADLDAWEDRPVEEILDRIEGLPADPVGTGETRQAVRAILDALPLPLSEDDHATIERFHGEFVTQGPGLRFRTFGRPPRPCYPTYRQLLLEADAGGQPASYVATEDAFRRVKALSADNLIVPAVGDLAGRHTIAEIGRWLRERGVGVSAFYTSNVEDYLWRAGAYGRFVENLRALPTLDAGMVVRSYFGFSRMFPLRPPPAERGPGAAAYCSVQLTQPISALLDAVSSGGPGSRSYEGVISAGATVPR